MANKITTTFDGDTRKLERSIAQLQARQERYEKRVTSGHARAAQQSARSWEAANQRIAAQQASIGQTLQRFSGVLAGAFGAQQAVQMADAWTNFSSKLINAGIAADQMGEAQQKLIGIAKSYGSELVSIGELYGSLSMATADLNTSQSDLMSITETVAASLKLSGASTAAAGSTILQLSQAIASGSQTRLRPRPDLGRSTVTITVWLR